jgi:hypothetical protein
VADDVHRLHPENTQQRATVGGVLREADGPNDTATARTSDAVVVHKAISGGKERLVQERREPVGVDPRVDEDHRLSGAMNLVLNFNAVESGSIHLDPPRVPAWTTNYLTRPNSKWPLAANARKPADRGKAPIARISVNFSCGEAPSVTRRQPAPRVPNR